MGYEGYTQYICGNGHYFTENCYSETFGPNTPPCPWCGESWTWRNGVDETNGTHDPDTGERIDGYVELEVVEPPTFCRCDKCDNSHIVKQATYRVPGRKS